MLLYAEKKKKERLECHQPTMICKRGNKCGKSSINRCNSFINVKKGLYPLFLGIVIVNGSDQTLSAPLVSFAFTLMLYEPFPHVWVVLTTTPELYGPSQLLCDPSPQSHR